MGLASLALKPTPGRTNMTSPLLRPALAALAFTAALAFAAPSIAAPVSLKADLKAPGGVPPNESKGPGPVEITYDGAPKMLPWKGSYSARPGPAPAAHFHGPAEPGKNAG